MSTYHMSINQTRTWRMCPDSAHTSIRVARARRSKNLLRSLIIISNKYIIGTKTNRRFRILGLFGTTAIITVLYIAANASLVQTKRKCKK